MKKNVLQNKYVDFSGGYFDRGGVHWLLRDGLGSVGMTVDGSGQVEQHVQYYPYGEPHREPQGQPYLYGGKERRRFGGLNDYDFHARFLNPAAALWHAPDPHASRYPWLSPYAFCASNPVRYSDPTGMVISTMIDGVRYTYERGQQGWNFYSDGKKYDGDNQYVSELLRSLRTLQCKAVGNALVRSLVEDTEVITIRAPQDGEPNHYLRETRTITWDPNRAGSCVVMENDGFAYVAETSPFVSLAHEMFHAESHLFGTEVKIWGGTGDNMYITEEQYAVLGENYIRAEHEKLLRVGYGITEEMMLNHHATEYPYGSMQPMFYEYEFNNWYFKNDMPFISRLKRRQHSRDNK